MEFEFPLIRSLEILELDSCESTNSPIFSKGKKSVVVKAMEQTTGRGQQGSSWDAEKGKNLLFSIHMASIHVPILKHYLFNMACCLGVRAGLSSLVSGLSIKWPNDIYFKNEKVVGLLLETTISKGFIGRGIIGVGINVNQMVFGSGINASSLKRILGRDVELDDVLTSVLKGIDDVFELLNTNEREVVKKYHDKLMFLGVERLYKTHGEGGFKGRIERVNDLGQLVVMNLDTGYEGVYNPKEIQFDL